MKYIGNLPYSRESVMSQKNALNASLTVFSMSIYLILSKTRIHTFSTESQQEGEEIQEPDILLPVVLVFTIICLVVTNQPCASMRIFSLRQRQHPPISNYFLSCSSISFTEGRYVF